MNKWQTSLTITLFFVLISIVIFNYKILSLYRSSQVSFLASTQQLLEINYRLDKELHGTKTVLNKLEGNLSIQRRIAEEQKKLINLQSQISNTQAGKINGLEGDLSGAKTEILQLKKTGGEPLPKDFINSLLKATVRIRCLVAHNSHSDSVVAGSGSVLGRYEAANNEYVVMTNAHVLEPKEGTNNDYDCDVIFGAGYRYDATVITKVSGSGYDFGFLKLGEYINEPTKVVSYAELGVGFCEFKDVAINDAVTVLSYPGFTGPEHAVSNGEITDILDGPIYEASAMIDLGSSGGVAISNKKRCVLGMPTWKGVGDKLGLGYIQSWPMMLSLNNK